MSKKIKYVVGILGILGCCLCVIGLYYSFYQQEKISYYSCNKKNGSENEFSDLGQKYDFEYSTKEQKVTKGEQKLSISYKDEKKYAEAKEEYDWTENFKPDRIETDDEELTITFLWNKMFEYNDKKQYSIEKYLSMMESLDYSCEKIKK